MGTRGECGLRTSAFTLLAGLAAILLCAMPAQAAPFAYVSNGDGTVSVIDAATNSIVATVTVGLGAGGLAITPDGAFVYAATTIPNFLSVIATATNTLVAQIAPQSPLGVAITPDGAFAYVTASGVLNNIHVIATATNTEVATITLDPVQQFSATPYFGGVAISPDGAFVYVTGFSAFNHASEVAVIATATNSVVAYIPLPTSEAATIALSPDGAFAYVTSVWNAGFATTVSVIATATNTVVGTVTGCPIEVVDPSGTTSPTEALGVAITPDGAFAYVTCTGGPGNLPGAVIVIRTADNTVVATIPFGANLTSTYVRGVAISPDGGFAYVASCQMTSSGQIANGSISVISTASNTVVATTPVAPTNCPNWIAFTPAATTTSLTAVTPPTAATFGSQVTLTATVSPPGATGTVTFYDGTTVLGDAALSSGVATFTTTLIPAGAASLTARYVPAGGAPYASSVSTSATAETVNAAVADSLAAAPNSPFGVGNLPQSVAVGDFNNDGKADLAVANTGDGTLTILLGDGTGNFTATMESPISVGGPVLVAVADFNNDGKPDLAVANTSSGALTILLGDATGNFTASGGPIQVGGGLVSVVVADFNNDGRPDLAVGNAGGILTILLGDGTGAFTAAPESGSNVATGISSLAVADFNNDGIADVAVANFASNNVTILLGQGNGTFLPSGSPIAVGTNPQSIAVGDFKGNGIADLAVANQGDGTVTVLLGDGTGNFAASGSPITVGTSPISVAVGDFNGDGKLDLAVANEGDGTTAILLGDDIGAFTPETGSPFAAGTKPYAAAVADFNADGKSDLAVANSGSASVTVLLGVDVPTQITANMGTTPQSAAVGAAFTAPLAVTVEDAAGNLLSGVPVTFTANPGSSGQSGTFMGSVATIQVNTSSGIATEAFTANNTVGSYTVSASVSPTTASVTPLTPTATFSLSNTDTPPTVLSVTSTTGGGSYTIGAGISITVTFSKNVTVAGTPQLALNSGGTAYYTSGSGTSALTFNYTVAAGQNSSLLDVSSPGALTGTIQDSSGTAATLTLPTGSGIGALGAAGIIIDTLASASLTQPTGPFPATNGNTTSSTQQTLTFTNSSPYALSYTPSITGPNAGDFLVDSTSTCPNSSGAPSAGSLGAGGSCTFIIDFHPTANGAESATLSISDAAPTQTASLSGTGIGASLRPATLSFADTSGSNTQTLTFTNYLNSPLSYTPTMGGQNPLDFVVQGSSSCANSGGSPTSSTLAANSSCTFLFAFTPTTSASESAGLSISDTDGTQNSSFMGLSGVMVTETGLLYSALLPNPGDSPGGGTTTFTVTNNSGSAITGPVYLVLANLPTGVTAANSTGTYNGSPYWTVTAGSLATGATTVTVQLNYATGTAVSTTSAVYAGSLP